MFDVWFRIGLQYCQCNYDIYMLRNASRTDLWLTYTINLYVTSTRDTENIIYCTLLLFKLFNILLHTIVWVHEYNLFYDKTNFKTYIEYWLWNFVFEWRDF